MRGRGGGRETALTTVRSVAEPLFNAPLEAAARRRAVTTRSAARLLRAYAGGAEATCALWSALAAVDRLRGAPVEFAFWTGFRYDHPVACVSTTFRIVL